MTTPGMQRHRDKNGEIGKKHGNTQVRTLRSIYGPNFAPDFAPDAKLSDVLHAMDEPSLTKLVHDHEAGQLYDRIAKHS